MKSLKTLQVIAITILAVQVSMGVTAPAIPLTPEITHEFERLYEAWKQDCKDVSHTSDGNTRFTTNYWLIVNMGVKVLPLLSEKCEKDDDFFYSVFAWSEITGVFNAPIYNPWSWDWDWVWWEGGQKLGNKRSEFIVAKIKEARKRGDKEAEENYWHTLNYLGLYALETLLKELKAGDEAAIPSIKINFRNEIKAGKIKQDATAADLLEWWEKNKDEYKLPQGGEVPLRQLGNARSEAILVKIKDARKGGDIYAEEKHWLALEDLDVYALETLFKELKAGDEAAMPPIKEIFTKYVEDSPIKQDASVAELLAWWEQNKDDYKVPPDGEIPLLYKMRMKNEGVEIDF